MHGNRICIACAMVVMTLTEYAASAADGQPELWTLAQDNLSIHRFSTSVKPQEMKALFRNSEALDKAVRWCQQHGITRNRKGIP